MLKKYRKAVIVLSSILAAILIVYAFRGPILVGMGGYLIVNDKLQRADIIKPLEGGPSARRLDYAIKLYKEGYADKILLSGGEVRLIGYDGPQLWTKLATEYAISKGVLEEAIITGGITHSTFEEALDLRRVMEDYGFDSVIVVSDPPHMRRVAMTFNRFVKDKTDNVKLIYHPIPLEKSEFVLNGWWEDEASLVAVAVEYIKIVYYYFKYLV